MLITTLRWHMSRDPAFHGAGERVLLASQLNPSSAPASSFQSTCVRPSFPSHPSLLPALDFRLKLPREMIDALCERVRFEIAWRRR